MEHNTMWNVGIRVEYGVERRSSDGIWGGNERIGVGYIYGTSLHLWCKCVSSWYEYKVCVFITAFYSVLYVIYITYNTNISLVIKLVWLFSCICIYAVIQTSVTMYHVVFPFGGVCGVDYSTYTDREYRVYVGIYNHGSLHVFSGSRQKCEEEYVSRCTYYATATYLVLYMPKHAEYICRLPGCQHTWNVRGVPCYAVTLQSDRPEIPRGWGMNEWMRVYATYYTYNTLRIPVLVTLQECNFFVRVYPHTIFVYMYLKTKHFALPSVT